MTLARRIIEFGATEADYRPEREPAAPAAAVAARGLGLPWPEGLAPTPGALEPEPTDQAVLPKADVVVITWTVAEHEALADVLTPGVSRNGWYRYAHLFETDYRSRIRPRAPAAQAGRLGSYYPTRIGDKSVLCLKSELHLNQDGVKTGPGTATLPVADFFRQIVAEVEPKLIITVGTAGATFPDHQLGDVVITRAAKFRLAREFEAEPFANASYRCDFELPSSRLEAAKQLLAVHADRVAEPDFGAPTKQYDLEGLTQGPKNRPDIKLDGRDFAAFHPILTTDFFEFGNSVNRLEEQGCGVEMGDAVLGMVCDELGAAAPRWLVIRNASDPQINGDLPTEPVDMQAHWAVWYYETYGYWTSINSAIATWAMIAGE